MKASEVLRRYAQGERDFRRVDLRGQSFKGKDLSGTDFSEADIRGANFQNAILIGTKFCGAKAGLQKRWTIFLALVSWVLAGLLGFLFAFAGALVSSELDSSSLEHQIAGWVVLVVLIVLLVIFYRQGLSGEVALAGALVVALAVVVAVAGALAGTVAVTIGGAGAVTVAVTVAGALAGAVTVALAITVASALAISVALAITVASAGAITVAVTVAGALAITVALAGALVGTVVSAYLGWRAMKGDLRDAWVRNIAVAFAATGGTSFYNANIIDADFTNVTLKSTDLRAKNLLRTCFHQTEKLIQARVGKTILADAAVRELLVTGQGEEKSYVDANLRGANLTAANLKNANLKFADLSEATLEYANLEGANLTQINAVGTNFTNASLTGACIEAWNIESSTKLNNVDCRYIYLLEHPKSGTDDYERRPSSGEFQPGEFTKLFEEVLDTVDLIFRNGIDWKEFVTTLEKVKVENEGTELTIQSIENKGDGVVVVRVSVPPNTDKEKIHQDFTQNYDLALKAIEEKYKAQLNAKDNEITLYRQHNASLEGIINTLANRPINIDVKAEASQSKYDQRESQIGAVVDTAQTDSHPEFHQHNSSE